MKLQTQRFLSGMICALLSFVVVACNKAAIVGSSQPGNAGASKPNNVDGTYAGGGGNGLNGVAIETYHQDISTLPEFQMYITPILERMAQSSPDIFVGYLNWAIHHKTWYFVPVALPNLPKEKTALAFPSDQLALHSESEIYIDQIAYQQKPRKERAVLLMHELVMGARLLMKHSAKFQCQALNSSTNGSQCEDEAIMKLASNPPTANEEHPNLTGSDDEAVRSMTAFLMTRNQDYTGYNVRKFRIGLGYNYPWDRLVSTATLQSVEDAFATGAATNDIMYTLVPIASPEKDGTTTPAAADPTNHEATPPVSTSQTSPRTEKAHCDFSHYINGDQFTIYNYLRRNDGSGVNFQFNYRLSTDDRNTHSEGVLDPRGGSMIVDHVHSEPRPDNGYYDSSHPDEYYSYDFYITREEHPRMIRMVITRVAKLNKDDKARSQVVPVRGVAPVVCSVED